MNCDTSQDTCPMCPKHIWWYIDFTCCSFLFLGCCSGKLTSSNWSCKSAEAVWEALSKFPGNMEIMLVLMSRIINLLFQIKSITISEIYFVGILIIIVKLQIFLWGYTVLSVYIFMNSMKASIWYKYYITEDYSLIKDETEIATKCHTITFCFRIASFDLLKWPQS